MLGTGMNARKLGTICALLAATPNLIGCESSRDSPDRQFQKQVKRAQECRELQEKLVGDQALTPELRTYRFNSKKRRLSAPGLREQCPI
jgi:hypothetical protein